MRFPIVIHKDPTSDYGVTVPDLLGCFSAGDTVDDALTNVIEAIECHVEGLLIDGETIPKCGKIESHQMDERFACGMWAIVEVDLSKLSGKSRRVNITLPERVLSQIDSCASRMGNTRSGFLANAAMEYLNSEMESETTREDKSLVGSEAKS